MKSWQKVDLGEGTPVDLLQLFYDDPNRENFRNLQAGVLMTMLQRYDEARLLGPYITKVYERSIRVARTVFMESNSHLLPQFDKWLLNSFSMLGESMFERDLPAIYLTCDDIVMLDRVRRRDRHAEKNLSDYQLLDVKHRMDRWAKESPDMAALDTTSLSIEAVARGILEWHESTGKSLFLKVFVVTS